MSRPAGSPEPLLERANAAVPTCTGAQPEVASCQETGLRQCTAVWRKGETVIDVITWGMSPPMVERVQCRAGCR